MTGVTKFSLSCLSDSINYLQDISLDNRYATLTGFTAAEIRANFARSLEQAAKTLSLPVDDVIARICKAYGGYLFDSPTGAPHESMRVCSPWEVLNFLKDPEKCFKSYKAPDDLFPRIPETGRT